MGNIKVEGEKRRENPAKRRKIRREIDDEGSEREETMATREKDRSLNGLIKAKNRQSCLHLRPDAGCTSAEQSCRDLTNLGALE